MSTMTKVFEFDDEVKLTGVAMRFRTDDRVEYVLVAPDLAALQHVAEKLPCGKTLQIEKAQRVQIIKAV